MNLQLTRIGLIAIVLCITACKKDTPASEAATAKVVNAEGVSLPRTDALGEVSAMSAKHPIDADKRGAVVFIQSTKTAYDGTSTERRAGSGFLLSNLGYVLTAGHVVFDEEDGYEVKTTASFSASKEYRLELVNKGVRPDVALLQLPSQMDQNLKWLKWGDSREIEEGDPLFALGFPEGLPLSLVSGLLSNRVGVNGNWQTTLPLNRGMSGGPVFDSRGRVVAIAVAGNESMQGVTYAIPGAHTSVIRTIVYAEDARRSADFAAAAAAAAAEVATAARGDGGGGWMSDIDLRGDSAEMSHEGGKSRTDTEAD